MYIHDVHVEHSLKFFHSKEWENGRMGNGRMGNGRKVT